RRVEVGASQPHAAIRMHEVASARTIAVTSGEFRDYAPAFDPDGKYLYFLSARTFDPVYDNIHFDLSFPRASRPYLVALQAGGPPPFEAEPKGFGKAQGEAESKEKDKEREKKPLR